MNSCRVSLHACPTAVRKSIPARHSSRLGPTSEMNAWRWRTAASMTSCSRRSGDPAKLRTTLSRSRSRLAEEPMGIRMRHTSGRALAGVPVVSEDLKVMEPKAFYLLIGDGRFESTPATAGPWSADSQHGGPPSALLARAFERLEPDPNQRLA